MGKNIDYYFLISVAATEVNSGSTGIDIIVFLDRDLSHIALSCLID